MLTYPDEYMSRCFEENLMHNSTASRINLLPNKPFKYKRVWTIQYFCSWVYFNAFQVFVWNMHLMAIEWKLLSMFFFLACGAFYFAKNHFMSSKIFPVLVSFSFYIEQVHSKPRDCIFLKLANNTALRKCGKTSSPVFALCYKNSFTSIVWTLLRCKLEFIQPSFTALLFASLVVWSLIS